MPAYSRGAKFSPSGDNHDVVYFNQTPVERELKEHRRS
jgi:hypothetical protein